MNSPARIPSRIVVILFAVLACTVHTAAQINYPDFRSLTNLRLVGTAMANDSVIELNAVAPKVAGGLWFADKQPVANGFTTHFRFQITDTSGQDDADGSIGGDGIVFVIQNAEPTPLGGAGGLLGYDPIRNSIAIEFDTYMNDEPGFDDPNSNHVGLHTTGTGSNSASNSYAIAQNINIPNLSDGRIHDVTITYLDGAIRVYLDGCAGLLLALDFDLQRRIALDNGRAWVGITASTGSAWERHVLYSWTFNGRPLITPQRVGMCANGFAALVPPGGFNSYQWSTGSTTRTINVRNPGRYTVRVTDSISCTPTEATFIFDVVASIPPRPNIAQRDTLVLCDGKTATLDGGPFASWTWSTGSNSRTISVSTPGDYWVSVTDTLGCVGSDTVRVLAGTRPPTPLIAIVGKTAICDGDSTTLEAPAGFASYVWSNGATTRRITVRAAGNYSVTVTSATGCPAQSTTVRITVVPRPYPVIQPSGPTSFCRGGSVTLDAGEGYGGYQWSNGATTRQIVVDSSGVYSVAVVSSNGCPGASSPITITVHDAPTPVIVPDKRRFCAGDTVVLRTLVKYASYRWSSGETSDSIVVTGDGEYTVSVVDSRGCVGTSAPYTVAHDSLTSLRIAVSGATEFCDGSFVTLAGPDNLATYTWSTGDTTRSIDVRTAGMYRLVVTDSSGCVASDSMFITVHSQPNARVTADTAICAGSSVMLAASGGEQYSWSPAAGLSCTDCAMPLASPTTSTQYRLIAVNDGGCADTAWTLVAVIPAPHITIRVDGDHLVYPGLYVDVPVVIDGPVSEADVRDVTVSISYSPSIMLLRGIALGNEMLTGWQLYPLVDSAGAFSARFQSTDGRALRDGQTLFTMRMQTYLGWPLRSPIVATLGIADRPCATIGAIAGSVTIDSMCGVSNRLIRAMDASFALQPVVPNPFNPSTTVVLEIGAEGDAILEIHNAAGERVAVLHDGAISAGKHEFPWDASAMPSGLYIARARSGEWTASQMLMLVK